MPINNEQTLLLASASSRRLDLLRQINVVPDTIIPADIDESQLKNEKPLTLTQRLSGAKARRVFEDHSGAYILAADTVVACGQKVLDKAKNSYEAKETLKKLSGRRHQVYGGITLICPDGRVLKRSCKTLVQFKPLSEAEIENYIESGEWEGKAGAYGIQGIAGGFVKYLSGSYSNVVGLSLYDTMQLLKSGGYADQKKPQTGKPVKAHIKD